MNSQRSRSENKLRWRRICNRSYVLLFYYPHAFLKKRRGYCNRLRPSVRPSVCLSSVRPSVRYAISS